MGKRQLNIKQDIEPCDKLRACGSRFVRAFGAQGGAFGCKIIYQRHPGINKIARWAIWHIFLTSLDAPYFASKTEKYAFSASLRSAPSVCKWVSLARVPEGEKGKTKDPRRLPRAFCFELVGQNCNSVKSRILCLRFINIEIIPLNTVLVNRFLKSFCKIIETMSYYFLYLMYKYRLKRGKPILSLSFLCCFYFS